MGRREQGKPDPYGISGFGRAWIAVPKKGRGGEGIRGLAGGDEGGLISAVYTARLARVVFNATARVTQREMGIADKRGAEAGGRRKWRRDSAGVGRGGDRSAEGEEEIEKEVDGRADSVSAAV